MCFMTTNLWIANESARFWRCEPDASPEQWQTATATAISQLEWPGVEDEAGLLSFTLGEGWRGTQRWRLSPAVWAYYQLKPLIPGWARRGMRRAQAPLARNNCRLGWPIEDRYVRFRWEVIRQLLLAQSAPAVSFRRFWPDGRRFALVLTHDVETAAGQAYVREVAALEESCGLRSSFNFVPERYPLDRALLNELRQRDFEIGVHGLNHDGKLYSSADEFAHRSTRINHYLRTLDAVGFRSPLTHRHPEWMQALQIEYDLSFFDTDPYEPMPGGTMSIWPFFLGHFVELPYTLVQDYTLLHILQHRTPQLWLDKVDFIERYCGLALLNTHPDYLADVAAWNVYTAFLQAMRARTGYWHGLPRDAARWWRMRAQAEEGDSPASGLGTATLAGDALVVT